MFTCTGGRGLASSLQASASSQGPARGKNSPNHSHRRCITWRARVCEGPLAPPSLGRSLAQGGLSFATTTESTAQATLALITEDQSECERMTQRSVSLVCEEARTRPLPLVTWPWTSSPPPAGQWTWPPTQASWHPQQRHHPPLVHGLSSHKKNHSKSSTH